MDCELLTLLALIGYLISIEAPVVTYNLG
jgi:hypothetical protein